MLKATKSRIPSQEIPVSPADSSQVRDTLRKHSQIVRNPVPETIKTQQNAASRQENRMENGARAEDSRGDAPDRIALSQVDGARLFHAQGKLALFRDEPTPVRAGRDATQGFQRRRDVRGNLGLFGARLAVVGDDAQPMTQFALLETMQCHA
ncbi:hypothetical protein FOC81_17255 [Achromobacter denitrificans]|uniref:Uncharacterized protein n=1 Tax=Achromobacter denitrificans TaxID=32002 RepID=A0A6N0JNS8_ACHDE|nr:hypothetical protein FOC81_17255 [Achromobacter denitrificans]